MVASYQNFYGMVRKGVVGIGQTKFRVQCSTLTSWGIVGCGEYVSELWKAVAVTVVLDNIAWIVNCTIWRD